MTTEVVSAQAETTPFLGLCMIVRDASETIDALLNDIKGAFDEIVIVDTGSVDDTPTRIAKALGVADKAGVYFVGKTRIVLSTFQWIDDFATARDYSFSLGTATWRMYLDADDRIEHATRLIPTLRNTVKNHPEVNCISIPYIYAETIEQDKHRIFRWADGWKWQDEIHEYPVRLPGSDMERRVSKYYDLKVVHAKSEIAGIAALHRNIRICTNIYNRALEREDQGKASTMAYYLGQYEYILYEITGEEARCQNAISHYLHAVSGGHKNTNLGAYCYVALADIARGQGDLHKAKEFAALAYATAPELPDGLQALAYITSLTGNFTRAAILFNQAETAPMLLTRTVINQKFEKAEFPLEAKRCFLALNELDSALKWDAKIDPVVMNFDLKLRYKNAKLHGELMKQEGLRRLKNWLDFMLWDVESIKALKFLKEMVPAALADHPKVGQLIRETEARAPQLKSWDDYKATYSTISEETYHTAEHQKEFISEMPRAKSIAAWASNLEKTGDPISLCSVGFQDGYIEEEVLNKNDRIQLTITDVAPQCSRGVTHLTEKFPGRVTYVPMTGDDYSWPSGPFDAVVFFEVLEHVRDDHTALTKLRDMLKPNGTLFLSTPVADKWIETYHTDPTKWQAFNWHVRAYNPTGLWRSVQAAGLEGNIGENIDGTFFCELKRAPQKAGDRPLSIYVPATPIPFDPDAIKDQHVGGSEEAIIHLSASLAKQGFGVTIYTPRREREDGFVHHVHENVTWRKTEDFDPGADHGIVMFWRCPGALLDSRVKDQKYKKILWLHDTSYGMPKEAYAAADKVIVLSKAHIQALKDGDGYDGANIALATNGVVAEAFAAEKAKMERDPHKVIYASSPDRGLVPLLEIWPRVREKVPDASLDIYYSWEMFEKVTPEEAAVLKDLVKKLEPLGVKLWGGVSHDRLHEAYKKSGVWAYFPRSFLEISCISSIKSQASGCWPVVRNLGALPETTLTGDIVETQDQFLDRVVARMTTEIPSEAERVEMSKKVLAKYDWNTVASRFNEILSEA